MRKFISEIPAQSVTEDFTAAVNAALIPLQTYKVNLNRRRETRHAVYGRV
jgi:hypothetical protein